jgi:predicted nucleotidyltransferase
MDKQTPAWKKKVTLREIRKLTDTIAREFHPERIILFGSYAYGKPTPDSDVDLLVIMPHEGRSFEKAAEIRLSTQPRFPLDLLVKSPKALRDRVRIGDDFISQILKRGRVLYSIDNGAEPSRSTARKQ